MPDSERLPNKLTKTRLLCTFSVIVVIFVCVQLYLAHRAPNIQPEDAVRYKSSAYLMVKKFVEHCDKSDIKCILVDPWILKGLINEKFEDAHSPCRYLCKNHIYTFAVKDTEFDSLKLGMLPKLKAAGYDIKATYKKGMASQVATHIHLRDRDSHAIHIVILHSRSGWLWYGSDPEDEYKIEFTHHEGSLSEFEFDFKVTLDGIELHMPHYPKRFIQDYESSSYIPCNVSLARHFHDLHPKDLSPKALKFRKDATKAIQSIKNRLDNWEMPFWLSSGTLLGWYRQCDIIPYSVDVDVGAFITDHTSDLLRKLKDSRLALEHKFGKVEDSLQYAFDMGDVKLDIFFFYEDKVLKRMWNGGTDYESGEKFKYIFEKFDLCWTEFFGMRVRVPCDPETYLKANYGPNWFTPAKSWDWKTSPFNVHPNGEWASEELDEVIQLWDKKGKRITLEWHRDEL